MPDGAETNAQPSAASQAPLRSERDVTSQAEPRFEAVFHSYGIGFSSNKWYVRNARSFETIVYNISEFEARMRCAAMNERWFVEPISVASRIGYAEPYWLCDRKLGKRHWRDTEFAARMECAALNAEEEEDELRAALSGKAVREQGAVRHP